MERLSHVYGYEGILIFFHQNILDNQNNLVKFSYDQNLDVVQTILAPEIIFILNNGLTQYYYHSITEDKAILVGVIFTNGIWEVQDFLENPSGPLILALAKKGLLEALRLENEI